jgi:hypothetical protein
VSCFTSDDKVVNVVLQLKNPQLAGGTMIYDVRVLQGTMPDNVAACSLFRIEHRLRLGGHLKGEGEKRPA